MYLLTVAAGGAYGPFVARDGIVPVAHAGSDDAFAAAFANRSRNIRVEGAGRVVRVLPDDTEGGRHQRFIIRLASGQTLLIAHNLDIARRVRPLEAGDFVEFAGEYVWDRKGGVIHWTHRDPSGRHIAGWIRIRGRTYQ